jgi:type I restriction enzyme S subunit
MENRQLPEGWKIKKLPDLCEIEKNQGIYTNLPYVGMENIESNTAKFIGSYQPQTVKSSTFRFSPNHILYGRLRPYLNKVLAPNFEGHCSTEIFPIKPRECLNKNFLLYWLLMDSTVNNINKTCTGARMPRANMNDVLKFDFLLPPLSEQKRIVAILDEAFEGIDRAISNTEKNISNARELFESYLNTTS